MAYTTQKTEAALREEQENSRKYFLQDRDSLIELLVDLEPSEMTQHNYEVLSEIDNALHCLRQHVTEYQFLAMLMHDKLEIGKEVE